MPEDAKIADEGTKPRRKGLVWIVPAVALVAVGIWWGSTRGSESAAPSPGSSVKSTLHLETFVLNLADPDQRSYLRVGIDLGLSKEEKRGEPAPPVAQVRDVILGVLAQSRVDDLLTAKGKNQLKEDLLKALRERVPDLGVEEVYFTEFLIQR